MDWDGLIDKITIGAGGGVVAWLLWLTKRLSGTTTRKEVVDMIQVYSPYMRDRSDIQHKLEKLSQLQQKLDEHMHSQSNDLHSLKADLREIKTILRERDRRSRDE